MTEITIPGYKTLKLTHLVLDYNGTMACDGKLIEGVLEMLQSLSGWLHIHVITADTFGTVKKQLEDISCSLSVLPLDNQDTGKRDYVETLGPAETVCIGNGRNDRLMLREAALGIAVIQEEGAFAETLMAADVIVPGIVDALNLLANPLRLIATLRS